MSDLIEKKLHFIKQILLGTVTEKLHVDKFLNEGILPEDVILENIIHVPTQRIEGSDQPEHAFTMIGVKRLDNLHKMLDFVRKNNIKGDLIETGVWKGGATIFMKLYSDLYGLNKKIFVCDSFEGLPPPSGLYPSDNGDQHYTYKNLCVSLETVKNNFEYFDCLDENVIFIKGFFKDTLNNNEQIGEISLLRMDGDMYESTHDSLINLYDKVSDSGVIIVDDYCLNGCYDCINDFIKNNSEKNINLHKIDRCGVYWIK
jgi:O-methyltransferase